MRNSAIFAVLGMALGLGLFGCASIQSTSVSEISKPYGHRLQAIDTGHGFLMLSIPALDATAKLKAQCRGPITGVQTVTWMRNWFGLVQHYHQEVTGWCQNI